MEQVIGTTELRQQLTDVLQAVREQRATYIVETFGRSQAAIVNLDEYRQFRQYQEQREVAFVTGAEAKRRAQGYLTVEIAMALRPGEPRLLGGPQPVWRMPVWLHLRGFGQVESLGSLDVDATTGEVVPLSPVDVQKMQDRADAIARHLTS
ncbi:MAG TPA: hypothetical protein PKL67_16635 [Anaerolineae bacterium]|nr:hypothetical protein [Anaerolineae bacterium]